MSRGRGAAAGSGFHPPTKVTQLKLWVNERENRGRRSWLLIVLKPAKKISSCATSCPGRLVFITFQGGMKYVREFDGLRGLLALWVFAAHSIELGPYSSIAGHLRPQFA